MKIQNVCITIGWQHLVLGKQGLAKEFKSHAKTDAEIAFIACAVPCPQMSDKRENRCIHQVGPGSWQRKLASADPNGRGFTGQVQGKVGEMCTSRIEIRRCPAH